jgi:PhnB protein
LRRRISPTLPDFLEMHPTIQTALKATTATTCYVPTASDKLAVAIDLVPTVPHLNSYFDNCKLACQLQIGGVCMKQPSNKLPNGKRTVTPYIAVKGAAGFIDFVKRAFGAIEFGRAENPDGTIGHAEVSVGDSTLMVFDAKKEWHDTPSFLCVYVDDADAVFTQALQAGATQVTEMTTFAIIGDRAGRVRDPFGNIWWIQTHYKDVTPEEATKLFQNPAEMAVMQKMQETFIAEMNKHLL